MHMYVLAYFAPRDTRTTRARANETERFNFNILCISHVMCCEHNEYDMQLFYTHSRRSRSPGGQNNRLDRLARQRKRAANVQRSYCAYYALTLPCITDAFGGMKRATCLWFENFHLILYEQCSTNYDNDGDDDESEGRRR